MGGKLPWFKTWVEAVLNDPTINGLTDQEFRVLFECNAVARMHDGAIPKDVKKLGFYLRRSAKMLERVMEALVRKGLLIELSPEFWTPFDWNERQKLPRISTERVQRFRAKAKSSNEIAPDETRFAKFPETAKEEESERKTRGEAVRSLDLPQWNGREAKLVQRIGLEKFLHDFAGTWLKEGDPSVITMSSPLVHTRILPYSQTIEEVYDGQIIPQARSPTMVHALRK